MTMIEKSMRQALTASILMLSVFGAFVTVVYRTVDRPTIEERLLREVPLPGAMYPASPKNLPALTPTPLPELLAEYEKILVECKIDIATNLRPGLNDQQLDELENEYKVKLSADIRDLYKWHNGSTFESLDIFPVGRFVPLDESLKEKRKMDATMHHDNPTIQQFADAFLAHRKSWIEIIADGSGNGYYYDPERINDSSSFFYTAHDDPGYDFYPSVGNYIQQLLAENKLSPFKKNKFGITSDNAPSFEQDTQFTNKFGKRVH